MLQEQKYMKLKLSVNTTVSNNAILVDRYCSETKTGF